MFKSRTGAPCGILALAIVALASAVFAGPGDVMLHGSMSQTYLHSTDNNYFLETEDGTFSMFEMILNATVNVDSKTRIGAQLYGREMGNQGNNHVVVDWAFGDYRWRDWLGIRAGRVKLKSGFYNTSRDIDMVRNSILLPQSVYSMEFRNTVNAYSGFELYGEVPFGGLGSLEYTGTIGAGEMDEVDFLHDVFVRIFAAGGAIPPSLEFKAHVDHATSAALVWNTPIEGFRLGGTILTGDIEAHESFALPTGNLDLLLNMDLRKYYVLSAEYMRERWTLTFEFERLVVDTVVPDFPMFDPEIGLFSMDIESKDRRGGYYGQFTYQATDRLQLGVYRSVFHPDWGKRSIESPELEQEDTAFTVRYDLTDNWLVKVEHHFIDGTGNLDADLNPDPVHHWGLFAARSTFYF